MIFILLIFFVSGLILRFPIAFSLGISCLIYLIIKGTPLIIIPLKMYAGIDVFVLLSIPGFILAGNLMNQGGLTDKIIRFCTYFQFFLCLFRVSCDIFEIYPDNFSGRNKQMSQTDCQSTNLLTFFGNGKPQVKQVLV